MPIYEQAYRRYEARAALRQVRFWPITREALRLLFARRAFLVLSIVAWIPALGFILYVYGVSRVAAANPDVTRIAPLDGRIFLWLYFAQTLAAFVVTTFSAAGLVASDRRSGAMVLYLSRPLTRRDYMIGKLAVPLLLNLALTVGPGLLVYAVALGIAPDTLRATGFAALLPGVVAYGAAIAVATSVLGVGISAASRSARVAGLSFFAVALGLEPIATIARALSGSPRAGLISVRACLEALGASLLGVSAPPAAPRPLEAALVLGLAAAACLLVFRSRVRAVEIVT
jgi:ABC-type transport system involved in multi-copper enzyme maturation permease subunit